LAELLEKKKKDKAFHLSHTELSGELPASDAKGIISIIDDKNPLVVAVKKKAVSRPKIDPKLSKLIVWYLISAAIWLIFGTTVVEYIGIEFVAPELDSVSWLSFGTLRLVHINAVFWGWSPLGVFGLAYYVVPRVCSVAQFSIKLGWDSFYLIN